MNASPSRTCRLRATCCGPGLRGDPWRRRLRELEVSPRLALTRTAPSPPPAACAPRSRATTSSSRFPARQPACVRSDNASPKANQRERHADVFAGPDDGDLRCVPGRARAAGGGGGDLRRVKAVASFFMIASTRSSTRIGGGRYPRSAGLRARPPWPWASWPTPGIRGVRHRPVRGTPAVGRRPQYLLWPARASESGLRRSPLVTPLIGPHTINTMPDVTLRVSRSCPGATRLRETFLLPEQPSKPWIVSGSATKPRGHNCSRRV